MAGWAQKHGPINNCYGYTWTMLPAMKHFSGVTLKTQIFVLPLCRKLRVAPHPRDRPMIKASVRYFLQGPPI